MGQGTKKPVAPFGVATKRFNHIGFHPELDVTGAMKKEVTKAGPGSYNPQAAKCSAKRGICWKTKLEAEDFSKYLGYWNCNLLRERDFYNSLRGPGTNDIDGDYYRKPDFSVTPNTGFGTGKRFRPMRCDDAPPPVTYQRPDKTSTLNRGQSSKVMPFEWDGFLDRFRSKDPPYLLPPNRYDVKDDKGLDRLLNKVVSLRGPYDLFTGPRDGSTIKNHFAPPKIDTPEYGYVKPSDFDLLLYHPSKHRCGKFLKAPRYSKKPTLRHMLNDLSLCYKDPEYPGPADFNLSNYKSTVVRRRGLHPFGKSQVYARPPLEWTIFPGPGRYTPKPIAKCQRLKRPSWVFLTSGNRDLYKVVNYAAF